MVSNDSANHRRNSDPTQVCGRQGQGDNPLYDLFRVRVGALPGLNVDDLAVRPSGIGVLTVYRGDSEQYSAIISTEAVLAVNDYLDARRRIGEKVSGGSPLFRNRWDYQKLDGKRTVTRQSVAPDVARWLNVESVKCIIDRDWMRSGVKVRHGRSEFKTCHGFRKWFKTQGGRARMNPDDVEVLLGHFLPYHKPSLDALEAEYVSKAQPLLAIDERFSLKSELESTREAQEKEWTRTRLENLELKEKVGEHDALFRDLAPLIDEMKEIRLRELRAQESER